jgi:hypothetical protein
MKLRRFIRRSIITSLMIAGLLGNTIPVHAVGPSVSANPANYTPHAISGNLRTYARVGNVIYAGGKISTVKSATSSQTFTRYNIVAFNAIDGSILPFAPHLDGEVLSLFPSGGGRYLFMGGNFQTVDGISRRGVVKYDLLNSKVDTAFNANLDARVSALQVVNYRLFIAGSFSRVGTASRVGLASLNTSTGAVSNYLNESVAGQKLTSEPTRIYRFSVSPDQTKLVVIGNFTSIDSQSREQAAMFNLESTSATLAPWNSHYLYQNCFSSLAWYMRDIDWSEDGSYFVLVSTGGPIKYQLCDSASRWETSQANNGSSVPTWINYTGGDSLYSVEIINDIVYVGGHQRWLDNPEGTDFAGPGAVSRPGVGAIDGFTGKATSWNPTRTRGHGAMELYQTITPGATGLWIGSDTDQLGGEYHASIGFFPF